LGLKCAYIILKFKHIVILVMILTFGFNIISVESIYI
jgi:hypothetical protein